MINFVKKIIWLFCRRRKMNNIIKDSMIKNERILEQLNDNTDYDGMGNYGRFPPIKMKIQLGIRGSTDSINHIIIKIDNLMLVTADNLFLVGDEGRDKTGKNLVELLNTLAKDHEVSASENVAKEVERELNLEKGTLRKYIIEKSS